MMSWEEDVEDLLATRLPTDILGSRCRMISSDKAAS